MQIDPFPVRLEQELKYALAYAALVSAAASGRLPRDICQRANVGYSTQCFLLRIRLSCSHPAVKALLADWRIHRTAFENGRITSSDYLEWMLQWPPTLSAPDD